MKVMIVIDCENFSFYRGEERGSETEITRILSQLLSLLRAGIDIKSLDGREFVDSRGEHCGVLWVVDPMSEDELLQFLADNT